jgi:hypothetical protein
VAAGDLPGGPRPPPRRRPDVEETIKRSVQPYFVLEGNVAALLSAKDHVTIFLYDGGIVADRTGSSPAATATRPAG